ncbi:MULTISPECIES: hypothetical protein [unclassified Gordonia (in: high G+C Gram-positive bacteria)]|uniref:hypothetical protein n=1 Tax=Gordonia sp. B7-2 TaxID=3420932 RepID=UPI003D92437B
MTRPPEDDPRDPRQQPPPPSNTPQHPETRQFGPNTDPAAIGDPVPPQPDPMTAPTDQYGQFAEPAPPSQAYTNAGPSGGYPPTGYGADPQPSKNTGRTVGLVLAVVAALVVIGIVAFLILRGGGDESTTAGASSTTSSAPSSKSSSTTTTTTTTTTRTTSSPTSTAPSDQVTYQLTGGGSVITLSYEASGRRGFVASTGTPWSLSVRVGGDNAELTAIVVQGTVTCTIMRNGEQLSSATSGPSPLPLRCAAPLQ